MLKLKLQPDGFGFIYGTYQRDDETVSVNIMPPLPHWSGDMKLEGIGAPHATDWVVYIDGNGSLD